MALIKTWFKMNMEDFCWWNRTIQICSVALHKLLLFALLVQNQHRAFPTIFKLLLHSQIIRVILTNKCQKKKGNQEKYKWTDSKKYFVLKRFVFASRVRSVFVETKCLITQVWLKCCLSVIKYCILSVTLK